MEGFDRAARRGSATASAEDRGSKSGGCGRVCGWRREDGFYCQRMRCSFTCSSVKCKVIFQLSHFPRCSLRFFSCFNSIIHKRTKKSPRMTSCCAHYTVINNTRRICATAFPHPTHPRTRACGRYDKDMSSISCSSASPTVAFVQRPSNSITLRSDHTES